MKRGTLNSVMVAMAATVTLASAAHAGGLERGGHNIDQLFDTSRFTTDATAAYVSPQRKLKNAVDTNATNGLGSNGIGGGTTTANDTEAYWVPRIGFKAAVGNAIDCLGDYSQPYGAHSAPGANWVGANSNIETKITSDSFAATCSYKVDAGKGQFRVIGGVSHLEVSGFKTRLVAPIPGAGVGRLDLSGSGIGWRAGVAYEVPDIALRASLMYYSEVQLDNITGTLDLTQLTAGLGGNPLAGRATPVFGATAMPDSLELKLQSGVAPGWLVFGSVKWVDWSQLQTIAFCPTSTRALGCRFGAANQATSLDLLYRDGWTVTGGVAHKFNDMLSGSAAITWDRGTSTGIGTQTDTWTFGAGAAYTPNENVQIRFGGALGVLTSGSSGTVTNSQGTFGNEVSYSFGNDLVAAISLGAKIKF